MKLMAHTLHGEAQWCENVSFSAAVQKADFSPGPLIIFGAPLISVSVSLVFQTLLGKAEIAFVPFCL